MIGRPFKFITLLVSTLLLSHSMAAAQPADLVLLNGQIFTVNPEAPLAQALAVRGAHLLAVGDDELISALIGPRTRVIQLGGRLAIPGFIEGHGHFVGLGQSKMMLDLRAARSWDEIVDQVQRAVANAAAGTWIVGRGWHQEKWERTPQPHVDGYPKHARLSAVSPNHPVLLTHASGHMSFANEAAMDLAGVDADTADPKGGEIIRDEKKKPIGVFRETAQGLIRRAKANSQRQQTDEQRHRDLLRAIELAAKECLAKGVTSFQDAGSSFSTIDVFRQLADQDRLPLRLWVMVRDSNVRLAQQLARYRMVGYGHDRLTVRAIKRSMDGALGSHGAWLLRPYDDLPSSVGLNTSSLASIRETAQLARRHNYQLCVHAIGDRANRETLDLFEAVLPAEASGPSLRWRIEHAQHLHPDDIPRLAHLDVIASMQGIHCTSDAVYVIERLGLRRSQQGAYAWRSLLDSGAVIVNGTDAPVEDLNPIASFYASVTRQLPAGVSFFPEQCMTREEALRSYTLDAAYAAFEEDIKGSLIPGKLADIVVLSHDIMSCVPAEIQKAEVVYTIVGGKVVFEAER